MKFLDQPNSYYFITDYLQICHLMLQPSFVLCKICKLDKAWWGKLLLPQVTLGWLSCKLESPLLREIVHMTDRLMLMKLTAQGRVWGQVLGFPPLSTWASAWSAGASSEMVPRIQTNPHK